MQIGGSDQWGNIVNGVELIKRHSNKQVFGLTTPLITLASGSKMGKTEKGAVWLDKKLLSAYDYWQFWRNTDDRDVLRFLKMFTNLTLEKVEEIKNKNIKNLKDMLKEWPYFYAMMDMLDMVLAKTDQRIIKFYEECLGDKNLKNTGEKLRKQLSTLIYLNRKIIPTYILEQRKEYRDSIRKRNTYAEVLNILQADIMKKLYKKKLKVKDKKLLIDSMLVTIAGIAAAMKNVG